MNTIELFVIGMGIFFAFMLGRWGTLKLLEAIAREKNPKSLFISRWLGRENIRWLSIVGGIGAALLFTVVFYKFPQGCFLPLLVLILGAGFAYIINTLSSRKRRYPANKISPTARTSAHNQPISEKSPEINLDELFKTLNWEWDSFRSILIHFARKGPGQYIPAERRPNYVHLDGLQATIAELREISCASEGRETSRAVFVDTQRASLVISGKTHIGTARQVKVDLQPEPGRENVQIPVLTIHVHPNKEKTQGLSDLDYISFLSDRRQLLMMISYQDGVIFAMKTSATGKYSADSIQSRINTIRNDILRIWSDLYLPDSILQFNKAVCLEFGLTLYRAPASNENIAHRIEVTNL